MKSGSLISPQQWSTVLALFYCILLHLVLLHLFSKWACKSSDFTRTPLSVRCNLALLQDDRGISADRSREISRCPPEKEQPVRQVHVRHLRQDGAQLPDQGRVQRHAGLCPGRQEEEFKGRDAGGTHERSDGVIQTSSAHLS